MDLVSFITRARTKTWAGGMDKGKPSRKKSRGSLVYKQGNLRYEDEYFGEDRFQGQEIVYQDNKPVWGMVYYGGIVSQAEANSLEEFKFLKRALVTKAHKARLSGKIVYSEKHRTYQCQVKGNWNNFRGKEKISTNGKIVHEVFFAGGIITP